MRYGTRDFNITTTKLIIAEPSNSFCTANDQDFTGRIVVFAKGRCSPPTQLQIAKDQGAIVSVSVNTLIAEAPGVFLQRISILKIVISSLRQSCGLTSNEVDHQGIYTGELLMAFGQTNPLFYQW